MKKTFSGVIDRFEGSYAVVLIGPEQEEKMDIPKSLLPGEAREGDLVTLSIKVSPDKTKKAKEKVSDLIEQLKRGK